MLEQAVTVARPVVPWSAGGGGGTPPAHGGGGPARRDDRHDPSAVDYVGPMSVVPVLGGAEHALGQACKELAAAERVPELLAALVTSVRDMVGADAAWLGLREGAELRLRAHSGLRRSEMSLSWRMPVDSGIGGHVALKRQSQVVRNFRRDPRRAGGVKSLVDQEGLRSGAVVPFGDQRECFGALYVAWYASDVFLPEWLPAVEMVARVGGQLYAALRRREAQDEALERAHDERDRLAGVLGLLGEISAVLVDDGDLDAAVRMLAMLVGGRVWIVDGPGNVIAGRASASAAVHEVELGGTPSVGRLRVDRPVPLTVRERDAVAQVGRLVTLELLRRRSAIATEMRIKTRILEDLLDGEVGDSRALRLQAAMIGVDLSVTRVVVAVAPPGAGETSDVGLEPAQFEAIERAIDAAFPASLVTSLGGAAVAFLVPAETDGDPRRELGNAVARTLDAQRGLDGMVVGVGCLCPALEDYARSVQEALLAPSYASAHPGCGRVLTTDDMGLYSLLGRSTDPHGLATIVSSALGPLLEADRESGSEYVKTLTAYFEHDRHHDRTAAALHVHVNTLRYRLDRVRALLGVDLRDTHSRFILELATRINGATGIGGTRS